MPYEYDEEFLNTDKTTTWQRLLVYIVLGITIGWIGTSLYENTRMSRLLGQSSYNLELAKNDCEKKFNTRCIITIEKSSE